MYCPTIFCLIAQKRVNKPTMKSCVSQIFWTFLSLTRYNSKPPENDKDITYPGCYSISPEIKFSVDNYIQKVTGIYLNNILYRKLFISIQKIRTKVYTCMPFCMATNATIQFLKLFLLFEYFSIDSQIS